MKIIYPFVPNVPVLYPLKTSENLIVFWYVQGVKKGCIWNKWVKFQTLISLILFSGTSECSFQTERRVFEWRWSGSWILKLFEIDDTSPFLCWFFHNIFSALNIKTILIYKTKEALYKKE